MSRYSQKTLYETLKDLEVIPVATLDGALRQSKQHKRKLEEELLQTGLISDENLGKVVADLWGVPFINLAQTAIPDDVLRTIPVLFAKKQKVIAFKRDKQGLHVAMADPGDVLARDYLHKKSDDPIVLYHATERNILDTIAQYAKDVGSAFEEIIASNIAEAQETGDESEPPVIKLVETIMRYAYQNKASDIHMEPTEKSSLVRFRVDGVLHDVVKLPRELHERLVTRIKVLSKLRTDEQQAAQDGKLRFELEGDRLDIRVSVVPITGGEKIVMRLLAEQSRRFVVDALGLSEEDMEKVRDAYNKPHGMILATGPTGSGKTTTLYAILLMLNKRDVNIMTIEDPVEYDIELVNQIQVNTKTKLTFAAGLRSIVRQDPDIILVGEIRDEETADIAVNSAMTGHLVLSTLHTNDAATTIPRLIDMQVEPFLVASTVNIILAQRLVRKICNKCRVSEQVETEKLSSQLSKKLIDKYFGEKKKIRVYQGKGCDVCHHTGYTGRIGIFEVLIMSDALREAVVSRKDASEIRDIAVSEGMKTMLENGLKQVEEGVTTIEEVLRVTKE